MTVRISLTRRKPVPTTRRVGCRQICDGSFRHGYPMRYLPEAAIVCILALFLETTAKDRRYLTGHYGCEQCGQHFTVLH